MTTTRIKRMISAMGVGVALFAVAPALSPTAAAADTVEATVQVPIHVPINLCGNTIDIIGLLNPTFGSVCINS